MWPSFREVSQAEQDAKSLPNVSEDFDWSGCCEFDASSVPIHVLHVVRKNDACYLAVMGKSHFEGITFRVTSDRACDGEARLCVVRTRREDQSRSTPPLLMSGLRVERQPDEIASIGNVAASYHTSSPSGPPQSLSSWRFFGVMRRTSSSSE